MKAVLSCWERRELKSQTWRTLELEAMGFRSVQEPDGVIRISNRPEHVLFLSRRVNGHDASMQLGELVRAPANTDENRGLLLLERVVESLLDAAPAVLERRREYEGRTGASGSAGARVADA